MGFGLFTRETCHSCTLLPAHGKDGENRKWLKGITSVKTMAEVRDTADKRFLEEEKVMATR